MIEVNFESRQFTVYGLWRGHRLEFGRDGRHTRLIIRWSQEISRAEESLLMRCFGGALFDHGRSFSRKENENFYYFTSNAEVADVLDELQTLGPVEFTHSNPHIE